MASLFTVVDRPVHNWRCSVMQADSVWTQTLAFIQGRVPKQVFDTWFMPVRLQGIEDSTARVEVPNKFFGEWLGQHYGNLLAEALAAVRGEGEVSVAFVASQKAQGHEGPPQAPPIRGPQPRRERRLVNLNPKYTFTSFVVGASNQFAHAASMAVAEAPARAYNPLFIYGGVGLGKTHLMNAIGNHVADRFDLRIAYVTTEQFTNEVINSIRYDRMIELRKRYRNIDMLLIDDIQFLAGKERTQEEFFHKFNSLYEARKQIVLSSDRFPKEMPDIEERLRSRFECGLIADLQPPDVETRIAILRKKSEDEGIGLPEDVALFVATNIKANIRELEGSLIRLGAYASLTGQAITLEMAQNVLKELVDEKKHVITLDAVQEAVAAKFHIKMADLKSKRRTRALVYPRQIAMYLCREITQQSYPEIARHFGGKDHTTVMHACKQVEKGKQSVSGLLGILEELKRQITGA